MRYAVLMLLAGALVLAGTPALAGDTGSVFVDGSGLQVAHEEKKDRDHDDGPTREELRQRKRDLREEERELREREREQRREEAVSRVAPRFWVGVGVGTAFASVDIPCAAGSSNYDCTEEGQIGTYTANVTMSGPYTALRVRGLRQQDKGRDSRTAYEEAALIGSRFGTSNWYGFIGGGRIQHADDEFEGDTHGFAWEILFAPSSSTATGFELSFQGNAGEDVDFVGFSVGGRFGLLR